MVLQAALAVHRRLRGKQLAPAHYVVSPVAYEAIVDESWHEITALDDDARRKHVHWVWVRTQNPNHKQPETFEREDFWKHMCKVYRECYPESAHKTGSILLFGLVAQERHAGSAREQERALHYHFIAYTSMQHYWRVVAETSLKKYNVKLHAACHDGYTI